MGIIIMSDTKTTPFKMSTGDKSTDDFYGEEMLAERINKVNQKATLIAILVPCIIGVFILISYLDMRNRIEDVKHSKKDDVQVLTEDLEKRLETIKKEYGELEASIDKKISYIDKNTYLIKENVAKSKKTLKNLKTSKVDKKDQAAFVSQIDKKIIPIQKGINDTSAKIDTLEQELNKKIETLSASVEKSSTDISSLSTDKMDKDSLDIKLLNDRKLYQQQLDQLQKEVRSKLLSLQKQIDSLESISSSKSGENTPASGNISEKSLDEPQ